MFVFDHSVNDNQMHIKTLCVNRNNLKASCERYCRNFKGHEFETFTVRAANF